MNMELDSRVEDGVMVVEGLDEVEDGAGGR